ncbi:hypothetical protein [Pelomicrobium sp. G1]|uniref:hypothetical protein n=1 Tax=unclassified Pelomicrobium TaxID=2815318 RepID=UPI003F75A6BB
MYWRLVRSVRHGREAVQETVAQLRELDAEARTRAQVLARSITGGAQSAQRDLFAAEDGADAVPVQLGKVRLERMARRIAKAKRRLDGRALERQIGQLLERNARAAARYSIALEDDDTHDSGLRLKWRAHPEWDEWANLSEGTYILRSNVHEWSDEELWKTYLQLTEAEAAFRIHKSDLAIRPIWHQKAERIQAHILVCFLGYALWKTLQQWQPRAGLGDSPRTILTELSRITSADVVLPLADGSRRELKIRCVVHPDRSQALLIDRLGLTLPERLRAPQTVEM